VYIDLIECPHDFCKGWLIFIYEWVIVELRSSFHSVSFPICWQFCQNSMQNAPSNSCQNLFGHSLVCFEWKMLHQHGNVLHKLWQNMFSYLTSYCFKWTPTFAMEKWTSLKQPLLLSVLFTVTSTCQQHHSCCTVRFLSCHWFPIIHQLLHVFSCAEIY